MRLRREPINHSKLTNFKYLNVSQREHLGKTRELPVLINPGFPD